jgi:hypothetical protein
LERTTHQDGDRLAAVKKTPAGLSKKQIKDEITRCGRDPVYFIKNYCSISHPEKGMIPFHTFDYQDNLLKDFNNYRFNIILKARQLGISTIVAGYAAWLMLFRREKSIVVIATKFEAASNLVRKVKAIINQAPEWIKLASIKVNNQTSFELTNGSWIKAVGTSEDSGRSEALSLLIIDEAAFIERMDDIWKAIYPTISTGGRCIALSTPAGVGNWFHETYIGAVSEENDFHPVYLPWHVHPERDQSWFDEVTRNLPKRDVAQEHECSFNASGETVVDPEDIDFYRTMVTEPKYRIGFDRNFWVWEEYDGRSDYLIAVDVARGDGADNSAVQILKANTMEQVAEYQGRPNSDVFAGLLDQVGREYGNAMMVVENNTYGFSILEKLADLKYPNIYYSMKSTHEYIDSYGAQYASNVVAGFTNSPKTRPLIVAKLEEFIRNRVLKINSIRFVEELSTFVWNKGKPQSTRRKHDDMVISLAIACWVRDTAMQVSELDRQYNKSMLNSMYVANSKMSNQIAGQIGYSRSYDLDTNRSRLSMINEYQQHSWLFKG